MAKAIETLSGADETAFLNAVNDAITTDPGTTRTAIGIGDLTPTLHTSSPNDTVNALELAVTGGTTNTDLVLGPKGTGAFILGPEPDGTSTGGNKRGAGAIDLQLTRTNADQVASGVNSFVAGEYSRASGLASIAMGSACISTGAGSVALGYSTASALGAVALGHESQASGPVSSCFGLRGYATIYGEFVHSNGRLVASSPSQSSRFVLYRSTTNNSATEMFLDTDNSHRLSVPSGQLYAMIVQICGVKSDGSAVAHYIRQYAIKNVGGTTSQVYSPITIGTDNAAGTSIAISANDTNDALKIEVTGISSETWRWVAIVDSIRMTY